MASISNRIGRVGKVKAPMGVRIMEANHSELESVFSLDL